MIPEYIWKTFDEIAGFTVCSLGIEQRQYHIEVIVSEGLSVWLKGVKYFRTKNRNDKFFIIKFYNDEGLFFDLLKKAKSFEDLYFVREKGEEDE